MITRSNAVCQATPVPVYVKTQTFQERKRLWVQLIALSTKSKPSQTRWPTTLGKKKWTWCFVCLRNIEKQVKRTKQRTPRITQVFTKGITPLRFVKRLRLLHRSNLNINRRKDLLRHPGLQENLDCYDLGKASDEHPQKDMIKLVSLLIYTDLFLSVAKFEKFLKRLRMLSAQLNQKLTISFKAIQKEKSSIFPDKNANFD